MVLTPSFVKLKTPLLSTSVRQMSTGSVWTSV